MDPHAVIPALFGVGEIAEAVVAEARIYAGAGTCFI